MFAAYRYNALNEVQCWVSWRLGHGTTRSALGTMRLPADKMGYGRESQMAWYLDTQRRLGRLAEQDRRILVLAGLGHTQQCIAEELGYSLRSIVRLFREATVELEALDRRDTLQRPQRRMPHPSEDEVQGWLEEPRCQCWTKMPGRPLKKRVKAILAPDWRTADESPA